MPDNVTRNKLWAGRFSAGASPSLDRFWSSIAFDIQACIAPADML